MIFWHQNVYHVLYNSFALRSVRLVETSVHDEDSTCPLTIAGRLLSPADIFLDTSTYPRRFDGARKSEMLIFLSPMLLILTRVLTSEPELPIVFMWSY